MPTTLDVHDKVWQVARVRTGRFVEPVERAEWIVMGASARERRTLAQPDAVNVDAVQTGRQPLGTGVFGLDEDLHAARADGRVSAAAGRGGLLKFRASVNSTTALLPPRDGGGRAITLEPSINL